MYAVPSSLREASYGLGARRRITSLRVVFPAAVSGIVAALIVGFSRAVGETMIVALAAGGVGGAIFNLNPCMPGQTMTAAMTALAVGSDQAGGGIAYSQPLLRRPAAVRDDARAEPDQRALRAPNPERVLMADAASHQHSGDSLPPSSARCSGTSARGVSASSRASLLLSLVIALGFLLWLLADVFVRSLPVWQERGVSSFVGSNLSSDPAKAGIAQGLFGSMLLMAIVTVLAIPIGIAAAIYLEEYAPDNVGHPAAQHDRAQPRRRAGRRLRAARAVGIFVALLNDVGEQRPQPARRRPDAGNRRSADRDHHRGRSAAVSAGDQFAKQASASGPRSGRWSAATSCLTRHRASSPASS